ncbi:MULTISPECIES: S8 family peptidase [unclassified Streptomyces]|uniref:S8 family peptidase n=1 Tax=unclassified Streptomyces TaxID=2593676 RepID=UPI000DBA7C64|nr:MULTISPECIES: S8 family peptidase [unclassified Streptomyces]MYT70067.1 S8 family serine peptidase [Streptomyces sp. SID8367]RAJ88640.1 subtilase family protein [Streptomyces sp. PsTaAH-137]
MRTRTPLAYCLAAVLLLTVTACGDSDDDNKPDPMRDDQWALDALHLPDAWDTSKGDDTVIAVVDTGVDPDHPDLKGRLVDGHDFVDNDNKPKDLNGHGTHVSGIAAAHTDNGVGIAGGAPGAKIMPVRVLGADGSGSNQNINLGIKWAADHGADVINLSLGESGLMAKLLRGGTLNAAIKYAYGKGVTVVAAAGNDGDDVQTYKVGTPVLVVGASDTDGAPASFSNFGVDDAVSAPGVDILSTLPTYRTKETLKDTSGYGKLSGTSMASPYVAAVAALLHHEGLKPDEIMSTIRSTAKNPKNNSKLGLGIVDAEAAVKKKDS